MPSVGELENDGAARQALFIKTWRQQCSEKSAGERCGVSGWRKSSAGRCQKGSFWQDDKLARRLGSHLTAGQPDADARWLIRLK